MSKETGSPAAPGPAPPTGPAEPAGFHEPAGPAVAAGFHEPAGPAVAAGLAEDVDLCLPLLPGFREMALRRMSEERRRLVSELTAQRQSAGLSQTEVAARMGTSQSAVARLEAGGADVRVSTLERYAAAIGSQISWRVLDSRPSGQE